MRAQLPLNFGEISGIGTVRRTRRSSGQVVLVRTQSEIFLTIRKGMIGPRPMQILPDVHARQKWSKTRVERTFLSRLFANRSTTDPPTIAARHRRTTLTCAQAAQFAIPHVLRMILECDGMFGSRDFAST